MNNYIVGRWAFIVASSSGKAYMAPKNQNLCRREIIAICAVESGACRAKALEGQALVFAGLTARLGRYPWILASVRPVPRG